MTDALTTTSRADLASQEARKLEFDRQRKNVERAPVGIGSRALNSSFPGGRGQALKSDETADEPADPQPSGALETMRREQEWKAERGRVFAQEQDASSSETSGFSAKDVLSLLKGGGAGGAGPGGIPMNGERAAATIGNALIKASWANLWLTFGHSIYIIDLLFFAGWASNYLRKYIPEIGREWFPDAVGDKMPAAALLPIKLGELVAMGLITFLVAIIDLAILGAIGLILGAIMEVL